MRRYAGAHCEIYDLSWFLDGWWMQAGWQVGQARLEVARISRRVVNRGVALITSLVPSGAISNHNNDDGFCYNGRTAFGVPHGYSLIADY
jgi:hypothetical protein